VATFGAAAVIRAALLTSALKAVVAGARSLAGFAEGGYTGEGAKHQVAGLVHRGEFVADQGMTRKHRPLLEHLYENKPLSSFPGLASMLSGAGVGSPLVRENDALRGELVAIRQQLQSMESLHRSARELTVYADPGTTIKQMRKAQLRNIRG
jgi:hypothetical protein